MKKLSKILILISCVIISCGTLGGFDEVTFLAPKQSIVNAIDTFYTKHPEYRIPSKWKPFDNWKERGYGFLDSRIFYFSSKPKEMYYVTFLGDANDTIQLHNRSVSMAIRAINIGTGKWEKEEEISSSEKIRMQKRFKTEIVTKIKEYALQQ